MCLCKTHDVIVLSRKLITNGLRSNISFQTTTIGILFFLKHRKDLRDVEIEEVQKMLNCGNSFALYQCKCGCFKVIHFGCNSRVCTHCGKKYADKWAAQVAKHTLNVIHRHVVWTIAEQLRPFFEKNRELFKTLMDCTISAMSRLMKDKTDKDIIPGVVSVIHSFGKDMKFNPHVHSLVTEGGFTKDGKWVPVTYFPFELLRKDWQDEVLNKFKEVIPNIPENVELIDHLRKVYSDGFYVRAPLEGRVTNRKAMMRYIGRYIKHPAIAECRIASYDGKDVKFWYEDDDKQRHWVTMTVEEFITAIIGHIPDRQFKTVRYYGAYYRVKRMHFKEQLGMVSITQQVLTKYAEKWVPVCEKCGCKMELVECWLSKPPSADEFGKRISDWCYM